MKKLVKDTKHLLGFSIMTPIGASVITRSGGDAAVMGSLSSYTPTLGRISGASAVIRALKKY